MSRPTVNLGKKEISSLIEKTSIAFNIIDRDFVIGEAYFYAVYVENAKKLSDPPDVGVFVAQDSWDTLEIIGTPEDKLEAREFILEFSRLLNWIAIELET